MESDLVKRLQKCVTGMGVHNPVKYIASVADAIEAADTITRLTACVAELEAENKTFRNAQKACEDCDGPTMARVAELEAALKFIQWNLKLSFIRDEKLLSYDAGILTSTEATPLSAVVNAALTRPAKEPT